MGKRTGLGGSMAVTLALCLLGAAPATRPTPKLPFTVAPETTAIVAPLHADGTPDYVAAWNERYGKGVTAENNAMVPLLEIRGPQIVPTEVREEFFKRIGAPEPVEGTSFQSLRDFLVVKGGNGRSVSDLYDNARQRWWEAGANPEVAEYLGAQAKFLDKMVAASGRPRLYMPLIATGRPMFTAAPISFVSMADLANGLCARAMQQAAAGNIDSCIQDLIAVRKWARLWSESGVPIAGILGVTCEEYSQEALGTILGSGKLTEAQCRAAAAVAGRGVCEGAMEHAGHAAAPRHGSKGG